MVTVEEALRQQFGNDAVTFVAGACPSDVQVNQSGIQAAVAAASRADVIVMVLGDTGEGNHTTDHLATGGEGRDRCNLLPAGPGANQSELLQAVLAVPALAQRLIVVHSAPTNDISGQLGSRSSNPSDIDCHAAWRRGRGCNCGYFDRCCG